jgi:hypothetical protein
LSELKRGILFSSDFSQNFSIPFSLFFLKNIFLVKFHLRDHGGLFKVIRRQLGRIPTGGPGEGAIAEGGIYQERG